MPELPASVSIVELGPREGFQIEPTIVSTANKLELIDALSETGLATIEVASFVNPKLVPTMADAEPLGHVYDAATGKDKKYFVSGYSSQNIPNFWDRSAEVRAELPG